MEKSQRANQAEWRIGHGEEKEKGAMPLPRPHLAHPARRNFFGTAPHQGALPLAWCLCQTIVSLRDFSEKLGSFHSTIFPESRREKIQRAKCS